MGGMRFREPTSRAGRKAPKTDPLLDIFSVRPQEVSEARLFEVVNAFSSEKRKHRELLKKAQDAISEIYQRFSPAQRVNFFAMLYDRFAENYDSHMGIETRHYEAIRRTLMFALPHLRAPILDLTAGTGEPLMYALEFMEAGRSLQGGPFGRFTPPTHLYSLDLEYPAFANEISPKMLDRARVKLAGRDIGFLSGNAYELPQEFRGKFSTVLCAQTFHLISDDDKTKLVRSIRDALAPGGVAVVLEEDPFRITQTEYIEPLSLFLRAIVRPVKPDILVGRFEVGGFLKIDETASAAIDSEHVMRLHLFSRE
ncbi:MAG: class I SAM-dependent methyltransferase [Candidatus Micrarchaeota archaeon]